MASEPLRLGGVPEHFNLPWHLALDGGALDDLSLTWTEQPGGTGDMLAALAEGSLDVVSILTEGTLAAISNGLAATVVQVYVSSPLQWGVFVPGASDLHDEAELEGRPIAISRFRSGSHLMAFVHARRNDWDLSAEQFVVAGGLEGTRAAFAEGRAEVFLWDRFMTRPLVESGEFRQLAVQITPWPSFVIAARNEVLTGRTTEVGRVVDEVVGLANRLHRRPKVIEELSSRYGLDRQTVEEWMSVTSFAPRQPWDPKIGAEVRETLADAGLT